MLKFIRRVEFGATLVMSVAVILTAWASFQSSRWNGVQADHNQDANRAQVEAAGLSARAASLASIDVDVFIAWLDAVMSEVADGTIDLSNGYTPVEGTVSAFYYERFRDEMLPAMRAWVASKPITNADAPSTPFAMPEYRLADTTRSAQLLEEAEASGNLAEEAASHASAYTLLAVLLAMALFFAGISTKLSEKGNQRAFVVIADIISVGAVIVLIILPKAPLW